MTRGVSPHHRRSEHPVQRDTLVRCRSVFLTCGFLHVCVCVRLRGRLQGVSEDGIPRVKKIQKERKCLLSIVAGFPFAKQLCAPTRTHISGGTKSHGFGTKTRMSARAPPGVIEKPHSQLSGSKLSAHHTSSWFEFVLLRHAPQNPCASDFLKDKNNGRTAGGQVELVFCS